MTVLENVERPWSHDVWSFGVVLLEIISGCPIDKSDRSFIQSRIEKSSITKGIFAMPRIVLDSYDSNIPESQYNEADNLNLRKKFFTALDAVHQKFQEGRRRTLKQKDQYSMLEDEDLFDLVYRMLYEEP